MKRPIADLVRIIEKCKGGTERSKRGGREWRQRRTRNQKEHTPLIPARFGVAFQQGRERFPSRIREGLDAMGLGDALAVCFFHGAKI